MGSGSSPVIAGGLVLVNRDQQKQCSLLAVDLRTGKQVWEAARPEVTQSFGTPILRKIGGADEVVMSGSLKLKGYDLRTGAERWSLAGVPSFTCTTPVIGEGLLFFAGWAPMPSAEQSKVFSARVCWFDAPVCTEQTGAGPRRRQSAVHGLRRVLRRVP